MPRIPVTFNHDHTKVIGWLNLDEAVSMEQVLESTVSWAYRRDKNELLMMTLVPKPRVVIENS